MNGRKQKLKTADEYDFIFAKRYYCYLINNNKRVRSIKKALMKRYRAILKNEMTEYLSEINGE